MASSLILFHPNFLSPPKKPQIFPPTFPQFTPKTLQISCKNNLNDADLASSFANEVEKINTQQVQRERAMVKSREILFREMCEYFDLKEAELKRKWKDMGDDEKWVFVKGFVEDWGEYFYPLSIRSVKEMVDEHLDEEDLGLSVSESVSFSGFKKFWGF